MSDARKYVDATYAITQEKLAGMGIDQVNLFRGVKFGGSRPPVPQELQGLETGGSSLSVDVHLNPISSFSTCISTSKAFAGHGSSYYAERAFLYKMRVPRERILCTAATGLGCKKEQEVVVIGGRGAGTAQVEEVTPGKKVTSSSKSVKVDTRRDSPLQLPRAEFKASKAAVTNLDADLANADWLKRQSDLELSLPKGMTVRQWAAQNNALQLPIFTDPYNVLQDHLTEKELDAQSTDKDTMPDPPLMSRVKEKK